MASLSMTRRQFPSFGNWYLAWPDIIIFRRIIIKKYFNIRYIGLNKVILFV